MISRFGKYFVDTKVGESGAWGWGNWGLVMCKYGVEGWRVCEGVSQQKAYGERGNELGDLNDRTFLREKVHEW